MEHAYDKDFAFIIDPAVRLTSFACDVKECLGACCTLPGGRGAPVLDEEVESIREAARVVGKDLSEEHQTALAERGPLEGGPGDWHTTCIGSRACVFVVYDGAIARCAIERAHQRGETEWRKPISCHLYPIRVEPGNPMVFRYDTIPQCRPALMKGAVENTPLVAFLQTALERAFGKRWPDVKHRFLP